MPGVCPMYIECVSQVTAGMQVRLAAVHAQRTLQTKWNNMEMEYGTQPRSVQQNCIVDFVTAVRCPYCCAPTAVLL